MSAAARRATLYRMDMDGHTCPFGLKAKALLERQGFTIEDHQLRSKEATDAFKAEQGVKTTPQTFIDGARVGGYDDLRRHFGKSVVDPKATTYTPVIAIFAVTALMALAASWAAYGSLLTVKTGEWFIAFSMCVLAIQKLQNVETFSSMFLGYDLLAKRWVPYAYVYAYAEALAGVLMISGALRWISIPVALFIGGIARSVGGLRCLRRKARVEVRLRRWRLERAARLRLVDRERDDGRPWRHGCCSPEFASAERHLEHLVALAAAGRVHLDGVTLLLADERARRRRGDRHLADLHIGFGFADDLGRPSFPRYPRRPASRWRPNMIVEPDSFDTSMTSERASLSSSSAMRPSLWLCSSLAEWYSAFSLRSP